MGDWIPRPVRRLKRRDLALRDRIPRVRRAPGKLPPLNALRAFEAAGRHLSFKRAAAELHVTQAAVSHQVRALEAQLGVDLFVRLHRPLRPTPAGSRFLPALSEAVDPLHEASA